MSGTALFRVRGVPVRVHPSLVVLLLLLGLLALAEGGTAAEIGARLVAPGLLLLTVVLHEIGHALAALAARVRVVDIVLTPLGGAARLAGDLGSGRAEAAIAAAGPAVNLALAALCVATLGLAGRADEIDLRAIYSLSDGPGGPFSSGPITSLLAFNLLLGSLNLIPAFPLDGGRVLRGLLSLRVGRLAATRIASRFGAWFAVTLMLAPFFLGGGLWWFLPFVGLYLLFTGLRERLAVEAREGGLGMRFRVMRPGAGFRGPLDEAEALDEDEADGVIDVPGRSRVLGDAPDDGEERR